MISEANKRLQKIADFVHNYLNESYEKRSKKDKANLQRYLLGVDYRWQHTLRVSQFGKVIAENEGVDLESITAACLLHDIAWFDTTAETNRDHGRLGAEISRQLLKTIGYDTGKIEIICYSVTAHVDEDNPTSLEAKIVSDADNVDRFGPYRILQWCFSDIEDYEKLTGKLSDRIRRLETYREENPLFTSTGRQLFAEQLNLTIRFFCEFVGEKSLTFIPQL
jgi:uncharacterized protein